jgi:precorrin-6B methylase 2
MIHEMRKLTIFLLACLTPLTVPPLSAQDDPGPLDPAAAERMSTKRLSGYLGMPLPVVEKTLALAQVRPGEVVYDLGSGDGRILITAAQRIAARGVGIELDPRYARLSLDKIRALGLDDKIQIIEGDVLEQDLSAADVVTIYMTPLGTFKLRPLLEKHLRDGARVVTCVYDIPGWKPASVIKALADDGKPYELKLYLISRQSRGASFSRFGSQR